MIATPPSAWIVYDEVDSTNLEIRRLREAGAVGPGAVVVADRQTAGRGRLGRTWHSPPGVGLYLSVLLPLTDSPELASRLTLAGALAVHDACRERCAVDTTVKWPNDVLFDSRKLAGVLAELRRAAGGGSEVILGIGVNVNHAQRDFPKDLRGRAASLRLARGGRPVDRDTLARDIVDRVCDLTTRIGAGGWSEVSGRFARAAPGVHGSRVRVSFDNGASRRGITRGLDPAGALCVALDDGAACTVRMGEAVEFVVD